MRKAYAAAIDQAEECVQIVNAYPVLTRTVRRALYRALARGVRVELMLSANNDQQLTPNVTAIQMKKLSLSRELDIDKIFGILREPKANQQDKISFRVDDLRKFFPKSYSAARIQETILKLLTDYYRKRQRSREER